MVSEQEIAHFRTFGFVVLREYLSEEETGRLKSELDATIADRFPDESFDGSRRYWVPMMSSASPLMVSLFEDPRFYDAAQALIGSDVLPFCADGNRYVGDTRWHPDAALDNAGVKYAFYLEPVGADSGALRVVPGSHEPPLYDRVSQYLREHGDGIESLPAYPCTSRPGDVVAFNFRMWHSSVGGGRNRPMLTLTYFQRPTTEAGRRSASQHIARILESSGKTWPGALRGGFYPPSWIDGQGHSPRRALFKRVMGEAGFFDVPGALADPRGSGADAAVRA